MRETRKQMYKILDKYMDKTLSFGCIICIPTKGQYHSYPLKGYKGNGESEFIITHGIGEKDYGGIQLMNTPYRGDSDNLYLYEGSLTEIEKNFIFDKCKIIGHYEIGAVLRYIMYHKEIRIGDNISMGSEEFNEFILEFEIPHKPLQLWTTEEEQNFINITKELGKKQ